MALNMTNEIKRETGTGEIAEENLNNEQYLAVLADVQRRFPTPPVDEHGRFATPSLPQNSPLRSTSGLSIEVYQTIPAKDDKTPPVNH